MARELPILETVNQTCERFGISRSHLYRLFGAGKIEARKDGKRVRIVVASAMAHFGSLPRARIKPDRRTSASAQPASAAAPSYATPAKAGAAGA